jgi:hypothetical protein
MRRPPLWITERSQADAAAAGAAVVELELDPLDEVELDFSVEEDDDPVDSVLADEPFDELLADSRLSVR